MLFGRIGYGSNPKIHGAQSCNLGDVFQTLAIDDVYSRLGIKREEIITVSRYKLESYDGPEISMVMNAWFGHGYPGARIRNLSPNIRPVYFGFHCISKRNLPNRLLKEKTLVGCRDEGTYRLLRRCGIPAFLSGCSTLLFEKRRRSSEQNKIYCVDVPKEVIDAVRERYSSNRIIVTHQAVEIPQGMTESDEWHWCDSQARLRLNEFRDNAALLVTSRLHCALPCIAMGIPIILIREHYDERFEWVDRFTKLYTNSQLNDVDWDPKAIDIDNLKAEAGNVLEAMILGKEPKTEWLNNYYMSRKKAPITPPIKLVAYNHLHEFFPNMAESLRLGVLSRFSMEKKAND